MWRQISLRTRLFVIVGTLILIVVTGGLVMMWYTYQMDSLFRGLIDRHLAALYAADGLKEALLNQKGFVSYYFLDGDAKWLEKLGEYRQAFKERLKEAREGADNTTDQKTIAQLESEYAQYISQKDEVIAFYKAGKRASAARLHEDVRRHFFKILELCDDYKKVNSRRIDTTRAKAETQANRLRVITGVAIWAAMFLGGLLAFVLVTQILNPLRRIAKDAFGVSDIGQSKNEVKAVRRRVYDLMEDVDQTKTQLERSQEHLLQSEKLALVGRLAAGMAHSIRNPLTSVKMRLFSLGRSLDLSEAQQEDFDVISEEIRHVDTIVQNFLEFSRPPKLKMQRVSPSDVVDMALQLLRHRLESYGAEVRLNRQQRLPEVSADPEQLKEVLVNLLVNSCEASGGSVQIEISEEEGFQAPFGPVVFIRVNDNGPGIPEEVQDRVFDPFFSSKEEGTGLGLSIAARILKDHAGRLHLNSKEGRGATFTITLPRTEE